MIGIANEIKLNIIETGININSGVDIFSYELSLELEGSPTKPK